MNAAMFFCPSNLLLLGLQVADSLQSLSQCFIQMSFIIADSPVEHAMASSDGISSRPKDAEPTAGKEIQVTVHNEEKVVCGVTKHTTCTDMIQALLDDHRSLPESKQTLFGEAKDFCLVERWKGFERALPPLTRILRLWYAWGDQRPYIQFILLETSHFVPQPAMKAAKIRSVKPKRLEHSRVKNPQSLPVEKQKRLVKKAFRKLEKIHNESKVSPGAEEIDRMVQLILNQDHAIREQIQRMRELDSEIEHIEAQAQGGAAAEIHQSEACGLEVHNLEQMEEFLYTSDGVDQLDLQVKRHQELIDQLSRDIDTELRRQHDMELEGAAAASWIPSAVDELFYVAELDRIQTELKRSLMDGVSLHSQAADIDKQLKHYEATLSTKDQECWQLAAHLSSLQVSDRTEETSSSTPQKADTACSISQTVKLKHCLSPLDITDTDSDTGISSTHSQDSLSPCLDFPPPLDTDV
ncbi:ras association domain-containing protein 9 isoform X2 [Synchiropus splendidus]|uniref:ras association domain-containing protein 9 isoform X2 n=1 Tax=Synchiropus splendidus TaxID=270530 RepID=UPI00237D5AA0|nr:ras association domain-containing protein 9 isoform X2 [Synchiropus splendidus]